MELVQITSDDFEEINTDDEICYKQSFVVEEDKLYRENK
jgi:hypothetical protein